MSSEREQKDETTLENFCVDCLENIFRYLPIPDLLNVADSSQQLRMVAELAFSRQYGKRAFRIEGFTSYRDYCWSHVYLLTGKLKIMLQLMRCFGYLLSRMEITLDRIDNLKLLDRNIERLMFYVKEYCVASLTEFTLLGAHLKGSSLNHFVKPFPNVHSVSVQSPVPENMSLIELFPKMRSLTYHCVKMEELSSIRSCLQSLDHLEITTVNMFDVWERWNVWEKWDPLLQKSILQLRSLSLPYHTIYPSMFSFDPLLNLQELKLNSMTPNIDYEPQFHSKTVRKLSIYYPTPSIASFPAIPFSFDNLEKLKLKFNATDTLLVKSSPEPFYDFISRHPTILKLRIVSMPGLLRFQRLMNDLPLLENVEICGIFDINDVIEFLNETKALKFLQICFYNDILSDIDAHVKARLKVGWHCEKSFISLYKFTRISKAAALVFHIIDD